MAVGVDGRRRRLDGTGPCVGRRLLDVKVR